MDENKWWYKSLLDYGFSQKEDYNGIYYYKKNIIIAFILDKFEASFKKEGKEKIVGTGDDPFLALNSLKEKIKNTDCYMNEMDDDEG